MLLARALSPTWFASVTVFAALFLAATIISCVFYGPHLAQSAMPNSSVSHACKSIRVGITTVAALQIAEKTNPPEIYWQTNEIYFSDLDSSCSLKLDAENETVIQVRQGGAPMRIIQ